MFQPKLFLFGQPVKLWCLTVREESCIEANDNIFFVASGAC
jgi:hypothetical protein